jgi:hypothetical protein
MTRVDKQRVIHFFIGQKSNIKKLDRKCIVRHHKWVIFVVLGLKYVDAFFFCVLMNLSLFFCFLFIPLFTCLHHMIGIPTSVVGS